MNFNIIFTYFTVHNTYTYNMHMQTGFLIQCTNAIAMSL